MQRVAAAALAATAVVAAVAAQKLVAGEIAAEVALKHGQNDTLYP